jgi:hypothetical protein
VKSSTLAASSRNSRVETGHGMARSDTSWHTKNHVSAVHSQNLPEERAS